MQKEAINSIEWAVCAAVFILLVRLIALIQATRGVGSAHTQVISTLETGDTARLEKKARGIGYRNPYGEVAIELIRSAHREVPTGQTRKKMVEHAVLTSTGKWARRTQQGQALDLVAFVIAGTIIAFSRHLLPTGPLFWFASGAMLVLLMSTLFVRSQLRANVLSSAISLKAALLARPELPSLSSVAMPCMWCGGLTIQKTYTIAEDDGDLPQKVETLMCPSCGKLVTTLSC